MPQCQSILLTIKLDFIIIGEEKNLIFKNVIKFNSYRYNYALNGYRTFQKNRIRIIKFVQKKNIKIII